MANLAEEKQNILQALYWSSSVKIIVGLVLAVVLEIMAYFKAAEFNIGPVIFGLIPVFLAVNISLFWLTKQQKRWVWILAFPAILTDIIIVTLVIYFSGEAHSELLFLYVIPAFGAAIISSLFSFLTSGLIVVSYLALEYWEYYFMAGGVYKATIIPGLFGIGSEELNHFLVLILITLVISFQARYYFGRIKQSEEDIMKTKDEFLFRTVHDLRSPAVAIRWFTDKCEGADYSKKFPELKEHIETVKDLNERILRIIQDLSDVLRGERHEIVLKKDKVDLRQIIRAVLKEAEAELSEKSMRVQYSPPEYLPFVVGDADALKEVFSNLVNNAVKYNVAGGLVSIDHIEEGTILKTIVSDTGRGIKEEDFPRLFTPYFRGSAGRDMPVGTGLGLYLCKKLVEKMGGWIEAKSQIGRGSEFSVSLSIANI